MPFSIFKYLFSLFSNISFSSTDIQISQVMIKYDEKRYLNQFVSEIFDSFQHDSIKRVPQYECKSFVTIATYWVPDLPIIKGIFGHFQHSIFMLFANGALYA